MCRSLTIKQLDDATGNLKILVICPNFFARASATCIKLQKRSPVITFFGQKFVNVTGQARCKENQTSPNPPAETGARQMTEEKTDRAIEFCPKDGMSEAGNICDRDWKNHG